MKRQRGRNRRNNNSNNANRSMESNGPDVKVRGTAKQIFDKYEGLARDAASSGNRVKAENYRQHAEHYLRIVNAIEAAKEKAREEAEAKAQDENNREDGSEDGSVESGESKGRRRYPPRARKSDRDGSEESASDPSSSEQDGLEVVEPSADADGDTKPTKSTRRRKAPKRVSEDESSDVEAAE